MGKMIRKTGKQGALSAYTQFADLYDTLMSDVDYDRWASYLDILLTTHAEGADMRLILDAACGTGAMTLRLKQRGYDMVGSDISEDMLRIAQQHAMEQGVRVPFVCQDMRSLSAHRPADAVLACCDAVNYLTSLEDVGAFFAAAYRVLKPAGLLLFDISSAYKLENILGEHTYGEDQCDCTYLWQNVFDPVSRLIEMDLVFFVREGDKYRRFDEVHVQRAHSVREINDLLIQNGFSVLGVLDAMTTSSATETSERMQWVARKEL
jgi:ubiquinone/menaquinone biosynthesis C-methylase UbiE